MLHRRCEGELVRQGINWDWNPMDWQIIIRVGSAMASFRWRRKRLRELMTIPHKLYVFDVFWKDKFIFVR